MYLVRKLVPQTFDDKLELLIKLGHFVSDRWPCVDDGTAESIRSKVTDHKSSLFADATASLQRYTSQIVDGEFGGKTARTMLQRRCGCPDIRGAGGSNWSFLDVQVWHDMEFPGVTHEEAKTIYLEACQMWNDVSKLDMKWIPNLQTPPNVFAHARRIDGPNGTLAWSMLPPPNAKRSVQLEQRYDFENWDTRERTFLRPTMCHEIGHADGLDHDNDPNSIMYYAINGTQEPGPSDIRAIQKLYGKPSGPDPDPTPPPDDDGDKVLMLQTVGEWINQQRVIQETWLERAA